MVSGVFCIVGRGSFGVVLFIPPNSIKNFEGLRSMFGRQFANSSTQDTTIFYLVNLT